MDVVIIFKDGSHLNYFKDTDYAIKNKIYDKELPDEDNMFARPSEERAIDSRNKKQEQLRDKVLDLLHKEVMGCFWFRQTAEDEGYFFQHKFQIYLSEIIKKAEEEIK